MLDLSLSDPVTIKLTYTALLGVLRRDEDKTEGSMTQLPTMVSMIPFSQKPAASRESILPKALY